MTVGFQAPPQAGWASPPLEGRAGEIATQVIDVVKRADADAPRSQQVAIGPSEYGTPCSRRIGYKLLDWPASNPDRDPWASIIGTAVHAWMADAFAAENRRLGRERYVIERRVHLPDGRSGACDLYDRDAATVSDWKVVGNDRLKKYRANGPGRQYVTQAHLYGLGQQLAGETPRHVAVVFLPRGGLIDGLHVWTESYKPEVAVQAIKRVETVRQFHMTADPEAHPERWGLLPTADAECTYCPWFLPGSTDLATGCPGHNQNS